MPSTVLDSGGEDAQEHSTCTCATRPSFRILLERGRNTTSKV